MSDQKLVNIRVDPTLWKRLRHRATDEDRTVTAVIVELVEKYLARKERK